MTGPAPFSIDTPTLLTKSLGQVVRARLWPPGAPTGTPLELERAQLSWDETRAPRCRASLTVRVPTDQAILDLYDPRTGARITIDAGYIRPGGVEDVQRVANLGLRARRVSRPDNRLQLELAGDESQIIDASPVVAVAVSGSQPANAMLTLLRMVTPSIAPTVTCAVGPAVNLADISDLWSSVDDMADTINADVYDDGLRAWKFVNRPTLAGTPDHSLTVGADGTVETSTSELDREKWFNAVTLRYRWRNAAGTDLVIVAERAVTAGVYAITGPAGKRTYVEERSTPTTQAAANAAGDALVKRFLSRARSYTLTAVSAYWLRPGMTVVVTLPLGDPELHLVSSVSFDSPAGTMSVTTRLPDNASTIGGA